MYKLSVLPNAVRFCLNALVEYLMPPSCLNCGEFVLSSAGLCGPCWSRLSFIRDSHCTKCGRISNHQGLTCAMCIKEPPLYDQARSLLDFNEIAKRLIHDFKYHDRIELAEFFASMLWNLQKDAISNADLILPVPMHPLKLLFRAYNQAHLLGKSLARCSGLAFNPFLLKKKKLTKAQAAMNRKGRLSNLKGSFVLEDEAEKIKGKNILLVDDVLTTGATVEECSRILKKGKANRVDVISIASVRF